LTVGMRLRSMIPWIIGLAVAWASSRPWLPLSASQPASVVARAAIGGLLGGFICGIGVFTALAGGEAKRGRSLAAAMRTGGAWSLAIATYNALAWGAIYRLALGPLPAECVSPAVLIVAGCCGGLLGSLISNLAAVPLIPGAKELHPTRCALALASGSVLGYGGLVIAEALAGIPFFWSVPVHVLFAVLLALSGAIAGATTSWLLPSMREAP